jgi:hypothetical protein
LASRRKLLKTIKKILVYSPIKYSERVDSTLRLTLLRYWVKKYQPHPSFENREDLYEYIARIVGQNTPISYLEFGVFEGASLLNWIKLNSNEESDFTGFDSFEGLPENWRTLSNLLKCGTFSTGGKTPEIRDARVNFIKGWFQDTLPSFLDNFSSNKQIIIHLDADLYSSTMYVLCKMDNNIRPGTIIIFDDFSFMLHGYRALDDYTGAFRRWYKVLGMAGYYNQVAIKVQ